MTFKFSRISKRNLVTSVEYLQRHFLNHPACFFSWNRPKIDRPSVLGAKNPAQCTGLELLPEPFQNKICYRLHWKYTTFSYFSIICSSAIWKSLFLRNRSYLRNFWHLEGSWLHIILSFCRQLLLRVGYSLVHFMKV